MRRATRVLGDAKHERQPEQSVNVPISSATSETRSAKPAKYRISLRLSEIRQVRLRETVKRQ